MKCAIMFADIVGSTRLYENLGDLEAAECVNLCLFKMSEITGHHNGQVINTIGDEILSRFVHAYDAFKAAIAIQEYFNSNCIGSQNVTISMRIGIHYGEIVNKDADVFGDVVNVASRVANIATSRQILLSDNIRKELPPEISNKIRVFDQVQLKGKQSVMILHEVFWEEPKDMTMIRTAVSHVDSLFEPNTELHLNYQGTHRTIQQSMPPFTIGRSLDCNLVINANLVSRVHAYCIYRRGKFILIDQSTNGTFIKSSDNSELYLRREEIPLSDSGIIGLGEPTSVDNHQLIHYQCV